VLCGDVQSWHSQWAFASAVLCRKKGARLDRPSGPSCWRRPDCCWPYSWDCMVLIAPCDRRAGVVFLIARPFRIAPSHASPTHGYRPRGALTSAQLSAYYVVVPRVVRCVVCSFR